MERLPQPKARLIVNIMDHGTVVGTEEAVALEFEDCVNAITGLVGWLASALGEVHDDDGQTIGTAILVDALHQWTFGEDPGADDDAGNPPYEGDLEDPFRPE